MNLLRKFARNMLAALETGRKPEWFRSRCAVCYNLHRWCEYHGHDVFKASDDLTARFDVKCLDRVYPFNESVSSYMAEKHAGTVYENPARMAFLKELAE